MDKDHRKNLETEEHVPKPKKVHIARSCQLQKINAENTYRISSSPLCCWDTVRSSIALSREMLMGSSVHLDLRTNGGNCVCWRATQRSCGEMSPAVLPLDFLCTRTSTTRTGGDRPTLLFVSTLLPHYIHWNIPLISQHAQGPPASSLLLATVGVRFLPPPLLLLLTPLPLCLPPSSSPGVWCAVCGCVVLRPQPTGGAGGGARVGRWVGGGDCHLPFPHPCLVKERVVGRSRL